METPAPTSHSGSGVHSPVHSVLHPPSHRPPVSAFTPPGTPTTASSVISAAAVNMISSQLSRSRSIGPATDDGAPDVEAGGVPAKAPVLLDSVAPADRITLEFRNVDCHVPRLFGPGATGGGLLALISYDTLRRVSTALSRRSSQLLEVASPPAPGTKKSTTRQVLHSVTGCCLPGELLALMGPSGSGKTSLLSILGGRTPKGATVAGATEFNGAPLTKRDKRLVGFVLQDDLLYQSLTVAETLHYAAALRLPRTMTATAKRDRVNAVITALGLETCRDTIIGGFLRRGISGGERKRVSVGQELLINPSVLLLDEPTSGLDATTAMRLVTTLRELAAGGRVVVTTIHQPSTRLFQQLDKLLLLSEGHAIYYGTASLAVDWFHRLGFTLPYGVNAPDFLLDIASGDVTADAARATGVRGDAARIALIAAYDRFAALQNACEDGYNVSANLPVKVVGEADWGVLRGRGGRAAGASLPVAQVDAASAVAIKAVVASGQLDAHHEDKDTPTGGVTLDTANTPASRYRAANALAGGQPSLKARRFGASYCAQIGILFTRAVKVRRFEAVSGPDFVQYVLIGIMTGFFFWQVGHNRTLVGAINTNGVLFFEVTFLTFPALFNATAKFPDEFKMMLKERASGMYHLSAFYFARTLSDLPMEMTLPSVFMLVMYFMTGLRLTVGAFLAHWAAIMLCTLVAQSFGMLVGAIIMHRQKAHACSSILTVVMMLVSGFFTTAVPVWIAWMKYASYVFYGYNLLIKIQHAGVTVYNCNERVDVPHPASDPNCVAIYPGDYAKAARLQINPETWPWEPLALIAWLVVLRYTIYGVLRIKTATK